MGYGRWELGLESIKSCACGKVVQTNANILFECSLVVSILNANDLMWLRLGQDLKTLL